MKNMNQKKKYQAPVTRMLQFNSADIITLSLFENIEGDLLGIKQEGIDEFND